MATRVFVYGSLLAGLHNHSYLKGASYQGSARTRPVFTMISLGAFPAAVRGGRDSLVGEVYEVDREVLEALDRLEGHPRFYRRTPVVLADGTRAELYLLAQGPRLGPVVPNGDWRAYLAADPSRRAP